MLLISQNIVLFSVNLATHLFIYLFFFFFCLLCCFPFFLICFAFMEYVALQPYSKQVLIGNWFDRRFGYDQKSNSIVPGLNSTDRCEQHRTLNQDSYSDAGYKGEEPKKNFLERRVTLMSNYNKGTKSNLRLMDSLELRNNYTTTNTLIYDWIPHLWQQPKMALPTDGLRKHQPEVDLLQAYGNLTKTDNYAQRRKCEMKRDKRNIMMTTYASSFSPLNLDYLSANSVKYHKTKTQ